VVRPPDLIGVVAFTASSSSVPPLELLAGPGRPIRVGRDDGIRVEAQAGLSTDDRVIISYTGSIEDGEPVVAESAGDVEGQGRGKG
jgi:hypothetical protein